MNILEQIIATKRVEVAKAREQVSMASLEKRGYFARACHSLAMSLIQPASTGIIAEFKRKSPSKGIINDRLGWMR
jgi:indole-3-glycerol phosphate synthase